MDEIDWWKQFKKGFKYMSIGVWGLTIFSFAIGLLAYIINHDETQIIDTLMSGLIIGIGTNIFLGITYGIVWIINKLTTVKIDINFNKEYIRELQKEYTPALVSLIYDFKTEVYRDYTSTILHLNLKKYINISGFNDKITITKGQNDNLSNLSKHELHVYNCVIKNERLDEELFKNLIVEDAQQKGLIKSVEMKEQDLNRLMSIMGIVMGITMLFLSTSKSLLIKIFMIFLLIGTFGMILFLAYNLAKINNNYKRTKRGKEELNKIKAFKNFIKEYTLIEEKDIEHIQILQEYIPYSLSLGTSPQVEEYIKQNEVYRNLIYKGRENWT